MEENQAAFWERIAREVSGNASAEDKASLNNDTGQDLTEAQQQAERIWKSTALPEGAYEPDVEHGWQRFQLRVQTRKEIKLPETKVRKLNYQTIMGIAASIALFIAVGFYFMSRQVQTTTNWTEVSTAANETKVINLTDGSTVSLNQNSTFSYPENFQKENRTVKLKGEAFFEVAKAEGKRFTIFAEGTKTEVIGTSFNLRAYEKEPVKVQVVTGKVAFARTATDDAIFLVPGQEGVIATSNKTEEKTAPAVKQKIANTNFQSWKTRNYTFTNMRLEELVETLENNFNTQIIIQNDALRNCRFTSSFKNPELKEVLDILAITGNLTITQDGNQYKISGTGCK